jgi:hypothetical protein
MYPHERSLVKMFKDRPFAIVGVNSDSDRAKLKKTVAKENITWRSFWDGGSTTGPIASRWGVNGWPTVYLIDHKGLFVEGAGLGKELEKRVEVLVKQAEEAARKK